MKPLKTILVVTGIVVITTVLTIRLYFSNDHQKVTGVQRLEELIDTVNVTINENGIPSIYAKNINDLFFIEGYLIAQERLFQLSLLNAIINADLHNFLEASYASYDTYVKDNFSFFNNDSLKKINPEYIDLVNSFCMGINTYIDNKENNLRTVFKVTGTDPRKWKGVDALNILVLMNKSYGRNNKNIVLNAVNQYYGDSRYSELANTAVTTLSKNKDVLLSEVKIEDELRELIGATGSVAGQNVWLFEPSPESQDKPIFVFEDMWGYRQPAKWFNLYLRSDSVDLEGSVLPGFPLPLVGRTKSFVYAIENIQNTNEINALFDVCLNSAENMLDAIDAIAWADTAGAFNGSAPYLLQTKPLSQIEDNFKSTKANNFTIYQDAIISKKIEIVRSIANSITLRGTLPDVAEILEFWNGDESNSSATALFVNTVIKNLTQVIFEDELSLIDKDIYKIFIKDTEFALNCLYAVVQNPVSAWIDDINTVNYKENLSDLVSDAIQTAVSTIREEYNNVLVEWSNINKPYFKHYLSNNKLLNYLNDFNVGPIPRGSVSYLNNNEYQLDNELTPVSTIALKKIYDLNDLNTYYSLLPTGQSGLPESPHYADQLKHYIKNELIKVNINKAASDNSEQTHKMLFVPAK